MSSGPPTGKPSAASGGTRPTHRDQFEASLSFSLDEFQREALDALDAGRSVVVAAPTGSGKTVVAEYAVAKALHGGGQAFYTTPIKALSNQKYADLVARHGAHQVGILTGDTSINPDAPVVVMTTEVLRNMIYARNDANRPDDRLSRLRYVVLDEVHYLQDTYRGPVWEEVIIHTPPEVDLVCLSATVSNAEELADWVSSVRGATQAVISDVRPTELTQLYLVSHRDSGELTIYPTFVDGHPNPKAARLDDDTAAAAHGLRSRRRLATPRRIEVVDALRSDDMLPALYFIFSRAACDEAMWSCVATGTRLTRPDERMRIRAIVEEKVRALSDGDLRVLDYDRFVAALESGFAAHHAGMVPPFKEAVERCFVEGLVKVVFATETLALGINMPARTVIIEKLTKFGGERHDMLTAGEYTQLTGRAGRRGIDHLGFAGVLWSPFITFEQVAALASKRTYELRSSFRPTFNMAVNLVRRYSESHAHELLRRSFAQFQIEAQLARLDAQIARVHGELTAATAESHCEHGSINDHRTLMRRSPVAADRVSESAVVQALEALRPGDVLRTEGTGRRGADEHLVVIATVARRGRPVQVRTVSDSGSLQTFGPADFTATPVVAGQLRLPIPVQPNAKAFRRETVAALQRMLARQTDSTGRNQRRNGRTAGSNASSGEFGESLDATDGHELSVATCPDLGRHLRAAGRADRATTELERLASVRAERSGSLLDQLDRVTSLLQQRSFLDGWALTADGAMLCGLFHECDLAIAECLRAGLLDGLGPPQLAGLISAFVYEARGPNRQRANGGSRGHDTDDGLRRGELPRDFPRPLIPRYAAIVKIVEALNRDEARHGLSLTRAPDPGFVRIALGWAGGDDLDALLEPAEITGGDFVRTIKAVIDLLRQLGDVARTPATATAARSGADALFRGVIEASSTAPAAATPTGASAGTPAGSHSGTPATAPAS